jgi:hypothetical protein
MSERTLELLQYFYEFAVLNDDGEDEDFTRKLEEAAAILFPTEEE